MTAQTTRGIRRPTWGETPLPRLVVADGTLEAMKWLGLVLMTLDHINKFLFDEKLSVVFEAGRIVMPVFGFVLAYNLARPGTLAHGAYRRTMARLLLFGTLATPAFVALVGWWPLNILFTLLLAVSLMVLIERGGIRNIALAALLFMLAGALVEYWWFALAYCLAAWAYCQQPTVPRLIWWIVATGSLAIVNGNSWALAALPLILAAPRVNLRVPRLATVFYLFYPAHLIALLAWQVR